MSLLPGLVAAATLLALPTLAAAPIPVPDSRPDHVVPVIDGCPPGYARDLMADCRPVRPPPPPPGYRPPPPPGYPPPGYPPPYAQYPHHGYPGPVAPKRVIVTCPPGYHLSRDGLKCWPNRY
ncbi:MAG: hypothetical protein AB7O80_16455 [Acetobacteraceae bacterium]